MMSSVYESERKTFFYIIGKFSELSYDIKILCASRSEESIVRNLRERGKNVLLVSSSRMS